MLVFALLWLGSAAGKNSWVASLNVTNKFVLGLVVVGIGYLLMNFTALSPGQTVSPLLITVCLVVVGVSEATVGPVGLSLVTRIAPANFRGQMIALKYYSIGVGSTISGLFGYLYTQVGTITFFTLGGLLCVGGGLALFAARGVIRDRLERFDA